MVDATGSQIAIGVTAGVYTIIMAVYAVITSNDPEAIAQWKLLVAWWSPIFLAAFVALAGHARGVDLQPLVDIIGFGGLYISVLLTVFRPLSSAQTAHCTWRAAAGMWVYMNCLALIDAPLGCGRYAIPLYGTVVLVYAAYERWRGNLPPRSLGRVF